MTRKEILEGAIALTCGDRDVDYGSPVGNMQHIADIFNAIEGTSLTAAQVATFHIATKLARMKTSPTKDDHYMDGSAYLGIRYECETTD